MHAGMGESDHVSIVKQGLPWFKKQRKTNNLRL